MTAAHNGTSQSADVQFVADAGTARVAVLAVEDDGAVADDVDSNSVQAIVTDAHDNPVSGAAVAFTATNGATVATIAATGADGRVTVTLTSTRAGTSTVTAATNGTSQSADVQFVADATTAGIDLLVAIDSDTVIANGIATGRLQALVTDANSNPVSGATVTFTATNGATVAPATGTTGADGRVTVTLTSTTAGTSTVTAVTNGTSLSTDLLFVADAGTARVSTMSVVTNSAAASGTATNSVRAQVTDASGNPVSGASVAFTATNGATVAPATGTTGADGRVTVTLTSTTAGISTVTAVTNGTSQTATVRFVADAATARVSGLTAVTNNAVANGTATNSVRASVTDARGNPVPGASVAFTATNGANIQARGTTGVDGSVTVTLTSTTAGTSTVTATHNSTSLTLGVIFVVDSRVSSLDVVANSAAANGTTTNSVRAVVTDPRGKPVAGASVALTATNGATVVPAIGTTASDGTVTATLTSTTTGTSTVTATHNGTSQTVDTQFVADAATARVAALTVLDDGAVADGTAANRVQALVTDARGNPLSGATVTFAATSYGNVPGTATTGVDGTVTVTVTNVNALPVTVTALHNSTSMTANVVFVSNPATARMRTLTTVNNGVANGTNAGKVTGLVTDANGNYLRGVVVAFTASNGAVIAETATTDKNASVTLNVTSNRAGTSIITGTINGSSLSTNVEFTPDTLTRRVASLATVDNNAVANGTATNSVRALVTDAYGNPVGGMAVSFSATNGAVIAGGTTGADGIVDVTLTSTRAGVSTVTSSINGTSQTTNVTFTADMSTRRLASVTTVSNNASADGVATNSVQALVTDANSNTLSGVNVTFSASGGATISGEGTTGEDGTVTMPVTSTRVGTSTIIGGVNGKFLSTDVQFMGILSRLDVTKNLAYYGSDHNRVKAYVTDGKGNPVSGVTVAFSVTPESNFMTGSLSSTSVITGEDGGAEVQVFSTAGGYMRIFASYNGVTVNQRVTFNYHNFGGK
ncbi:hypothetical protein DP187_24305 [Enterobacter cloacae]|nr:hypothetical protein DP187_24305 [Enterobacter cloacae]